jgi:NMD protein affecting ribosome stability and mRNA decay
MAPKKAHSMRCLRCGRPVISSSGGLAELCPKCLKDKALSLRRNEKLRSLEEERMEFLKKIIRK